MLGITQERSRGRSLRQRPVIIGHASDSSKAYASNSRQPSGASKVYSRSRVASSGNESSAAQRTSCNSVPSQQSGARHQKVIPPKQLQEILVAEQTAVGGGLVTCKNRDLRSRGHMANSPDENFKSYVSSTMGGLTQSHARHRQQQMANHFYRDFQNKIDQHG